VRGRLRAERLDGPRFDLQDQVGGLLGTPTTEPRRRSARFRAKAPNPAELVLMLMPTPTAEDLGRHHSLEAWDAFQEKHRHGDSLDAEMRRTGWGPYAPAIRRWERATGRPAPSATSRRAEGERLNPLFVEWMMGLPEGTVSKVPYSRALHILGNGVVPQQAALALRLLDPR